MTIHLQSAARQARDVPLSEAERAARVEFAALRRLVDARDPGDRD